MELHGTFHWYFLLQRNNKRPRQAIQECQRKPQYIYLTYITNTPEHFTISTSGGTSTIWALLNCSVLERHCNFDSFSIINSFSGSTTHLISPWKQNMELSKHGSTFCVTDAVTQMQSTGCINVCLQHHGLHGEVVYVHHLAFTPRF